MTTKSEKTLPRTQVIDRQKERTREMLEMDEGALDNVRGGNARYGLPPPPPTWPPSKDLGSESA